MTRALLVTAAGVLLLAAHLGAQDTPATWGAWSMPGRTADLQRYSPLTQITRANVKGLSAAWEFSTGVLGPHAGNPLASGTLLYVLTPAPTTVYALDLARPGAPMRWKYAPAAAAARSARAARGLAYHPSGKLFAVLGSGVLVALDAKTGQELWRVAVADSADAPLGGTPVVVKDVVVLGVDGGDVGARGRVVAYDVASGAERWRASSIGPDSEIKLVPPANPFYASMQGANLGVTTWPDSSWRHGGGPTTGWYSFDPELNLLYYGSGGPAPWNAGQRPGDNKWSMTIWARNPDDGRVKWAYQTTPHDEWGYDGINEMLLVDILMAGTPVKALVHFDGNGFAYTLDRTNGKLLLAEPYGPVTWASRIDLATGVPVRNAPYATRPDETTAGVCPAALGLKAQAPAAYSPQTGWFYVPTINACMDYRGTAVAYTAGAPFLGATVKVYPGLGGYRGRLVAWDAAAGRVKWVVTEDLPLFGGVLATGGGLVFYGTMDGWLKALDQRTGDELWRFKTAAGISGDPITFLGPDGRQYVAVFSGAGRRLPLPGGTADSAGVTALGDLAAVANPGGVLTVFALPAPVAVPK